MKDDNQIRRSILETLGVALFMVSFSIIGFGTLPIILILFPILFIAYGVKNGLIPSILIMVIVSTIVGFATDTISGLLLFLTFAPITIVLIYGIKSRRKSMEILAASSLIFFLTVLLIIGYMSGVLGINIATQLENSFKSILTIQVDLFQEMGLTNFELLKVKDLLERAYKSMLLTVPSIVIITSLIISYVNYYVSVVVLRKFGIGVVNIPRFSKFRLPNNIIPGTLVMFLGAYLTKNIKGFSYETILANLILLIGFMFYIQGLSVIDALMIKRRIVFPLRIVFLLIIVFFTPLVSIISILGLLDVLIDFRKIRKPKS